MIRIIVNKHRVQRVLLYVNMLEIQQNKPLSDLTTFEIGGPAKYYVEVKSEEEIRDALGWAREHDEKFFVMGGGSNLLVPDEGFDGLVIHIVSNQFNFSGDILGFLQGGDGLMKDAIKFNNILQDRYLHGNLKQSSSEQYQLLAPVPNPPTVRDAYAFRQHVETARKNRNFERDIRRIRVCSRKK